MNHLAIQQQYAAMTEAHQDFIQQMLNIAHERHDTEMADIIGAHLNKLGDIMQPEHPKSYTTPHPGFYNPNELDRENNPSLHKNY